MTIKEVEALAGLERATIRFYESQGLFAPRRLANSYRDYSEDDLQTLLRVKLLRSLHFSLEEILSLQAGDSELEGLLTSQIRKLEQEQRDLSYAREVCREIREEQATFSTLDAAKYLDGIHRAAEQPGSSYFTVAGDLPSRVFHPWRRFFARELDFFLCQILWIAAVAALFHVNFATRSALSRIFDTLMATVLMLFLEPLWLHHFRTTPGKAIFGLRVESDDGGRLTYREGLTRSWGVITGGLGWNLPIYNLVRLWKSYKSCSKEEALPWDQWISYSIKDTKRYRTALYLGSYGAAIALLMGIFSAQLLPPNRGGLTIAQFAENYNYYTDYLGFDLGSRYLGEDGLWVEKDWNETIYFGPGYDQYPDYEFQLEDGLVRSVSFQIEETDRLLAFYDRELFLTSLSLIGAQRELGLFSKIPSRMAKEIEAHPFESFSFEEAGVSVSWDTEYSGYLSLDTGFLWPQEGASEAYFRLNYTMRLLL